MTRLADLFSASALAARVSAGLVRRQVHPSEPLAILNYTEKCQFSNAWDEVTLNCRGLIYNTDTGAIVARPFPKFFNWGDPRVNGLDLLAPASTTDKLDGSLGISYRLPSGGHAIATRGSFTSDQALHATRLINASGWEPTPGTTALFEIVYPQNRIVVDYGATDELFLLAVLDNRHGQDLDRELFNWPGLFAQEMPYRSLSAALAAEPRRNAEGLVVRVEGRARVKIKQADYVRLHRIITGLNARTVWEWLGDGKTAGDLCATLPDDFHGWVEDVAARLDGDARAVMDDAYRAHAAVLDLLGVEVKWARTQARGDYARQAAPYDRTTRAAMFMLLDGRLDQLREHAWRQVKPSGAESLVNHTEAVA